MLVLVPAAVPAVPLIYTTMAATVGEVAFVDEEWKDPLPKNLIARLPVQVYRRTEFRRPARRSPLWPEMHKLSTSQEG